MKFDPKRIIDETVDRMGDQRRYDDRRYDDSRRDSYGRESDADDLIYKISRDLEEIRMKNRELNDRIADLETKFNRLRDLMRSDRRY